MANVEDIWQLHTCDAIVAFVMRCGWCLKSCRKAMPRSTEATAETTSQRDACRTPARLRGAHAPVHLSRSGRRCVTHARQGLLGKFGRKQSRLLGCRLSSGQHLLEEGWQVQLLGLWLILKETRLLQGAVAWVCQVVLLERI